MRGRTAAHLEVVWDLDNEAREKAAELGMAFARVRTAGTDPRFVRMIVELVAEHRHQRPLRKLPPCRQRGRPSTEHPAPEVAAKQQHNQPADAGLTKS